jgi:hypothetical protein
MKNAWGSTACFLLFDKPVFPKVSWPFWLANRKHMLILNHRDFSSKQETYAYIRKHFMDLNIQVRNREKDIDFNPIQAAEICHATAAEIFLFGCIVFSYITVFYFYQ